MLVKRKVMAKTIVVSAPLLCVALTACSGKLSSNNNATTPQPKNESFPTASTPGKPGASSTGQASGSYTAGDQRVELKYAYAGRGQRFGEDRIIVLLTDLPIPQEAVGEEIKSQTMLLDKKIRGLEYVFSKDGYWVRYHPGQYQESKSGALKDYSVENDVVKGTDEDAGDLTNGKYKRSVKFVATISK
jgi:hypothetical protein